MGSVIAFQIQTLKAFSKAACEAWQGGVHSARTDEDVRVAHHAGVMTVALGLSHATTLLVLGTYLLSKSFHLLWAHILFDVALCLDSIFNCSLVLLLAGLVGPEDIFRRRVFLNGDWPR